MTPTSDADVRDWWEWNHEDEWDDQMWRYGYAVLTLPDGPDPAAARVALVAEQRWKSKSLPTGFLPSRLWDGVVVSMGSGPVNPKARAQVRAQMPHMLGLWRARRSRLATCSGEARAGAQAEAQ